MALFPEVSNQMITTTQFIDSLLMSSSELLENAEAALARLSRASLAELKQLSCYRDCTDSEIELQLWYLQCALKLVDPED